MAMEDCFTAASSDSQWYEGLERNGSCLKLYDLLHGNHELIHRLGPDGITVLHKGVDHGCVTLVRFVLIDMFSEAGICICKGEGSEQCALTREGLLRKTTEYDSTAVNMAIVSGSPKMVLLLEWAIRVSCKEERMVDTGKRTRNLVDSEQYGELLKLCGCDNERSEEIVPAMNIVDEVPDVKDDEISESIYSQEDEHSEKTYDRDMQLELYKIIGAQLNERSTGQDAVILKFLKERYAKNVDFEFVPMEHIFLHFLIADSLEVRREGHAQLVIRRIVGFQTKFFKDIVAECKVWDENNKTGDRMQMTLFSILDPRGRTIMHSLFHSNCTTHNYLVTILEGVASESGKSGRCYSAKDGAGRTFYHMASIYDQFLPGTTSNKMKPDQYPHVNVEVIPLCRKQFRALQIWSFGKASVHWMRKFHQIPIYFAVLFNSHHIMTILLQGHAKEGFDERIIVEFTPFQLASCLGRTRLVEYFLKHQVQFKNMEEGGFDGWSCNKGALHWAAASGQVEVIQMILKYSVYDPMCEDYYGTALHAVVGMKNYSSCEDLKIWALHHVLPNSPEFKRIEKDLLTHDDIKNSPRDFTKNEKICINLLLQAGIEMWSPNEEGEFPNVGPGANNEARSWWYDKVVKEVEIKKTSITSAANAIAVVGALVATTSFIGPLQPPLSYSLEGHVNANPISIRVYLVSNGFSFFFSIASILMAVLPSIPMPKESLYDEMIRSERCLKAAVAMLLISIVSILVSFSSASIAVVASQWHDRQLIVASVGIGGGVCVGVLVIFIIRLIRMVFHKSSWLRRKFAKHMLF